MAGGSPRRGDRTSTTARPPSLCSTPSTGSLRFPPITVDGAVWSAAFTSDAAELAVAIGEEAPAPRRRLGHRGERASAPGVIVPALGGESVLEPQSGGVGPTPRPPAVALAGDELLLGAADGSLRAFDAMTFELRRRSRWRRTRWRLSARSTTGRCSPPGGVASHASTRHRASSLAARPGARRHRRQRLGGDLRPPRRDRAAGHVLLRQRVRPARRARPRQRLRDPGPRRPERQQRPAVARRRRHRTGQLRRQRSRRVTLAPRRLGADHPPRRPRIQRMVVQPGRRPPTRRARRGARRPPAARSSTWRPEMSCAPSTG